MRTQDFIKQRQGDKPDQMRWCSSVFIAPDGNFYSYGYHYPLLIKCGRYWLRNINKYSVTTTRHTAWCSGVSDFDINLYFLTKKDSIGRYMLDPESIKKCIKTEIDYRTRRLRDLSTRAFRQRQITADRLTELKRIYNKLGGIGRNPITAGTSIEQFRTLITN